MPLSVLESQSPAAQRHTRTPVSNRIASMKVTERLTNSGWIQRPLQILLVSKNTEGSFLLTISKETRD